MRAAGAARGFEFTRPLDKLPAFAPRRYYVWFYEAGVWRRSQASFPEGAAASYADVEHRYAGAIAMEAA